MKNFKELQELILAEDPESIWYDDEQWYVDTSWLVGGRLFEGKELNECLENMHEYLLEHMDHDDTEGMIITKSGYPDLAKVRIYLKTKREEKEFLMKEVGEENTMKEKELNLVEILKNAPNGTRLYSPLFDKEVVLDKVDGDKIHVLTKESNKFGYDFYERGNFFRDEGECLLFPSKENRDWANFKVEEDVTLLSSFSIAENEKKLDRTVRCAYCGREFIEPIPHRCNKNYRKRNLKWINIMKEEKERKQFNASEFISNKETPVETRDGRKVEIFTTTRETEGAYVVVGTTNEDYCEYDLWTKEGKFSSPSFENPRDLFFSPKKATRRMTNQELAWWLREHQEEHREFRFKVDSVFSTYTYGESIRNCPCEASIKIRSNGGEWREPEIEIKEENDKRD